MSAATTNTSEDFVAPSAASRDAVKPDLANADTTPATTTPPIAQKQVSGVSSVSTNSSSRSVKWSSNKNASPTTTQPSNCIVLKNLDYNITQGDLTEVVRRVIRGRRDFVNMSLVDDKATGTFRGVAFVTFASVADATAALTELSKVVINKRKVIAEYRRTRGAERKESNLHDKRPKRRASMLHASSSSTSSSSSPPKTSGEAMTTGRVTTTAAVATTMATTSPSPSIGMSAANAAMPSGKPVDKRALFFAKRDTERRAGEQRRAEQDQQQTERDRAREAEFRTLLSDYASGALRTESDDGNGNNKGCTTNGESEVIKDMVFDTSLSSFERRVVHKLCDELHLGHISRFDEAGQRVLHVTRDATRAAEWAKETGVTGREGARRRNGREGKGGGGEDGPSSSRLKNWFTPRGIAAKMGSKSTDDGGGGGGGGGAASSSGGLRPPSYKVYTPKQQPKGPDGTIGFHARRVHHGIDVENGGGNRSAVGGGGGISGGGKTARAKGGDSGGGGEKRKHVNSKGGKGKGGKGRKHSVLNPSVPAFSPMNGVH